MLIGTDPLRRNVGIRQPVEFEVAIGLTADISHKRSASGFSIFEIAFQGMDALGTILCRVNVG